MKVSQFTGFHCVNAVRQYFSGDLRDPDPIPSVYFEKLQN